MKIIMLLVCLAKKIILYNEKNMKQFPCLVYFSYLNALKHNMDLIISTMLFFEVKLTRAEMQRHY